MNEKPITILVVEDNQDLRETLVGILSLDGYDVLTAGNGRYALQQLHSNVVDLILSDMSMPEMRGIELLARVRANAAWAHIPFVFLTVEQQAEQVRQSKELGADDYLTKPIRTDNLLAAVRGSLRRAARWTSPNV